MHQFGRQPYTNPSSADAGTTDGDAISLSTSSRHNRKKVFVDTLYALVMRQAKCDLVELPQRSRHHYVTFVCNVMSPLALEKFGQSGIAKMNVELRKCINHATSPARAS